MPIAHSVLVPTVHAQAEHIHVVHVHGPHVMLLHILLHARVSFMSKLRERCQLLQRLSDQFVTDQQ